MMLASPRSCPVLSLLLLLCLSSRTISSAYTTNNTYPESTIRPTLCPPWKDDLPYNYDPSSKIGPEYWRKIDVCGNEWEQFVNHAMHNLDVDGNECKSTRRPSPVNLIANAICEDEHEILSRKRRSSDCEINDMEFTVHPNTLRATFPYNDINCIRPTVDLPNGYPHRWIMQWMEVHVRSEHVLDGRRYDAELQMMHLGLESQDKQISIVSTLIDASETRDHLEFQELLDQWQTVADTAEAKCRRRKMMEEEENDADMTTEKTHPNELKSEQRTNLRARKFVDQSHRREHKHDKHHHSDKDEINDDYLYYGKMYHPKNGDDGPPVLTDEYEATEAARNNNGTRKLAFPDKPGDRGPRHKMFPYLMWPTIHYYRYKGSITAPPCSEIVNWRVFDEPMRISRKQLKQLAMLINSYRNPDTCELSSITSPTGENYRPLKELNNEEQETTHCTDLDFTFWMYLPEDQ